tara:strand:- start:119 stop:328 length:210 start_codon:yes stop_codon:yes gene_type:complete
MFSQITMPECDRCQAIEDAQQALEQVRNKHTVVKPRPSQLTSDAKSLFYILQTRKKAQRAKKAVKLAKQ